MRHSQLRHFAGKGTANGTEASQQISEGFPGNGSGTAEDVPERLGAVGGTGSPSNPALQMAGLDGAHRLWRKSTGLLPRGGTAERDPRSEACPGGEGPRSRFFQRCLAKSRGSTPEQRQFWRDGIFDQIRELMTVQGSLGVERMCQLAGVGGARFYRV